MIFNKHLRYKLLGLVFACVTCNTALANTESKEAFIKIVSHGIYAHSPDNGKSWINPISDKVITSSTASPVHLKSTRSIPAQLPLFFGFEYVVKNLKGEYADITTEVSHPDIVQSDGQMTSHYQHKQRFLVIDNTVNATSGFLLETENEIQEGKWVFKIKLDDQTMATQSFVVTKK